MSHTPWSICASVWIFLVDDGWSSLSWTISLFFRFPLRHGLSFPLFLLFFWHALRACDIPSLGMHLLFRHASRAYGIPSLGMHLFSSLFFFLQHAFLSMFLISFCKAHISDDGFGERCHVYFVGVWMSCFARLPMWKSACICGVYVILIMRVWQDSK